MSRRFFERVWAVRRRFERAPDPGNTREAAAPPQVPASLPTPGPLDGDPDLGYGYVDRWKASREDFGPASFLSCDAPGTPPATRPHVMLRLRDLTIDFSRIGRKSELRHRPGYLRVEGGYLDFASGALRVDGGIGSLSPDRFPRDHFRDFVEAIESGIADGAVDLTVDEPTLAFFREPREFRNLFHAHTDWLSGFLARHLFDLHDRRCAVVLMDPHPATPFDDGFRVVASSAVPVMRAESFGPRRVRFRDIVFCAPGYASILWSRLEQGGAGSPLGLLQDYGRFLQRGFGADATAPTSGPVRVTFVSRRSRGVLLRRLAREQEILAALRSLPDITLDVVDMAALTLREQVSQAATTDILVGAHGAALAHAISMTPRGGLVEVAASETYALYRNIAAWMGHSFRRIEGVESFGFSGSTLETDPAQVRGAVEDLAIEIRERRLRRGE